MSSSLRHIGIFSEFIRIDDPEKLEIYQQQPESSGGKLVGSEESHSNKGTVSLMGGQFVFEGLQTSFVYNDSIYYILCDDYETFLAKIENKKSIKLETISNTQLCGSVSPGYKSDDNHLIVPFDSDNEDGYFDIFENEIMVRMHQETVFESMDIKGNWKEGEEYSNLKTAINLALDKGIRDLKTKYYVK